VSVGVRHTDNLNGVRCMDNFDRNAREHRDRFIHAFTTISMSEKVREFQFRVANKKNYLMAVKLLT
jgi:hypothetical protein